MLTLMFTGSAIGKLMGAQPMVEMFAKWELRDHLFLIGATELISALLFFIPRTTPLGMSLLSAYLGGAIVTYMQNGEPYFVPAVMLILNRNTGDWDTSLDRVLCLSTEGAKFNSPAHRAGKDANEIISPDRAS
ncbi:MAG: DoxX family protein [Pyrinomonadaceae bacterium]|nr:DoxX family protein [Pyrinomonadaceae bacterium]